jgi:hypothetical protein
MRRIIFLLLFPLSLYAAKPAHADSSGKPAKEHHHSKEYFLNKYGKDDSSIALIEFFFQTQRIARKQTFLWSAIGVADVILLNVVDTIHHDYGVGAILIILGLGGLLFGTVIAVGMAMFRWITNSQKRLLNYLSRYNGGQGIPRHITRKKIYQVELNVQKRNPNKAHD